ncbi:MAG: hypothetical protein K6C12_06110 [Oscillospiraceae bacterium]|nr:hypothetical protein [Oscillospiraceae bacterium]
MTNREKAERYDALMVAIKVTLEGYKRRQREHDRQYHEAQALGIIGAYSKGLSDAYWHVIADLERWLRDA